MLNILYFINQLHTNYFSVIIMSAKQDVKYLTKNRVESIKNKQRVQYQTYVSGRSCSLTTVGTF